MGGKHHVYLGVRFPNSHTSNIKEKANCRICGEKGEGGGGTIEKGGC